MCWHPHWVARICVFFRFHMCYSTRKHSHNWSRYTLCNVCSKTFWCHFDGHEKYSWKWSDDVVSHREDWNSKSHQRSKWRSCQCHPSPLEQVVDSQRKRKRKRESESGKDCNTFRQWSVSKDFRPRDSLRKVQRVIATAAILKSSQREALTSKTICCDHWMSENASMDWSRGSGGRKRVKCTREQEKELLNLRWVDVNVDGFGIDVSMPQTVWVKVLEAVECIEKMCIQLLPSDRFHSIQRPQWNVRIKTKRRIAWNGEDASIHRDGLGRVQQIWMIHLNDVWWLDQRKMADHFPVQIGLVTIVKTEGDEDSPGWFLDQRALVLDDRNGWNHIASTHIVSESEERFELRDGSTLWRQDVLSLLPIEMSFQILHPFREFDFVFGILRTP